jgi:hypothetical protein
MGSISVEPVPLPLPLLWKPQKGFNPQLNPVRYNVDLKKDYTPVS